MTTRLPHRRGFTLLEVLLTMGIGSVLLFVAVSMLGQAGSGYERGSGSVAAEREARAVLTQMGDDFAKAEWHKATILEDGGDGWKHGRLGFLSLQPDDAQSEDGRSGEGDGLRLQEGEGRNPCTEQQHQGQRDQVDLTQRQGVPHG